MASPTGGNYFLRRVGTFTSLPHWSFWFSVKSVQKRYLSRKRERVKLHFSTIDVGVAFFFGCSLGSGTHITISVVLRFPPVAESSVWSSYPLHDNGSGSAPVCSPNTYGKCISAIGTVSWKEISAPMLVRESLQERLNTHRREWEGLFFEPSVTYFKAGVKFRVRYR